MLSQAPPYHQTKIAVPVIEGWTIPETRMFLRDSIEFSTQSRFVYLHPWQLNDLVVSDNRATIHRGRCFDPAEARDVRQTRPAGYVATTEQLA